MINIKMDFDKDTANRLLSEALDTISEIRDILNDDEISDYEALQNIVDIIRKIK